MFLLRNDFADFASIPCIDSVLDQLLHAENEIKLKNWLNTDNFISIYFIFLRFMWTAEFIWIVPTMPPHSKEK